MNKWSALATVELTRWTQGGGSFWLKQNKTTPPPPPPKKKGRKSVRQKLYRKRDEFFGVEGGVGGGGGGQITIFLFGGFQKAEFRHKVEKFHPCKCTQTPVDATTLR